MGFLLHFLAGVGYRDGESTVPHDRQVNYVISHERGLARLKSFLPQNPLEARQLVLNALVHMLKFQVAGAKRHRLGDALGDQSCLDACQARQ